MVGGLLGKVGGWLAVGWRMVGGWLADGWRIVGRWLADNWQNGW